MLVIGGEEAPDGAGDDTEDMKIGALTARGSLQAVRPAVKDEPWLAGSCGYNLTESRRVHRESELLSQKRVARAPCHHHFNANL